MNTSRTRKTALRKHKDNDKGNVRAHGPDSGGSYHRQKAPRPEPLDSRSLLFIGVATTAGSLIFLVCGIYAVLVSSFMPDTGYYILDAIKYDEHYKYLLPLLVPSAVVAIIINWGGLHYFRHA